MIRTSGFERLILVKNALSEIHRFTAGSNLGSQWPTFDVPFRKYPKKDEEVIFVQWVAREVAKHYRIAGTTFVVTFNPRLESAARVEISKANEIFIEYCYKDSLHVGELWAVMAHEVAHIFLDRIGVRFADTLQNEVLTDATAIFLGFGANVLSSQEYTYTSSFGGGESTTTIRTVGYLSPDEMGYVLAQRDYITGESSRRLIGSHLGLEGYDAGKMQFTHERSTRPYLKRALSERIMHHMGLAKGSNPDPIVFPCVFCQQKLRIPTLYKALDVKCTNCLKILRCYS